MKLLENKSAIITGCSRGIGKAILCEFLNQGANVFAVVRKETEEFRQVLSEMNEDAQTRVCIVQMDFSDEQSVKEGAKEILSQKVPIDILVNNVGIDYNQNAFLMTGMSTVKETFQVNFFSHILLTQLISKNMIRNKAGSIVFISSAAAFDGGANLEYVSSKAALVGASKRLALEFGNYGIRVNTVAPGLTDTQLAKSLTDTDIEKAYSMSIMGRIGQPKEIANSVVFLASDMASFITGQVLHVDGGIR